MFSVIFYHARKGQEVRLDTSFTDHRWNIPSPVFCETGGKLSMSIICLRIAPIWCYFFIPNK